MKQIENGKVIQKYLKKEYLLDTITGYSHIIALGLIIG